MQCFCNSCQNVYENRRVSCSNESTIYNCIPGAFGFFFSNFLRRFRKTARLNPTVAIIIFITTWYYMTWNWMFKSQKLNGGKKFYEIKY